MREETPHLGGHVRAVAKGMSTRWCGVALVPCWCGPKPFPFEQSLKLREKCRCLVSFGFPKGLRLIHRDTISGRESGGSANRRLDAVFQKGSNLGCSTVPRQLFPNKGVSARTRTVSPRINH